MTNTYKNVYIKETATIGGIYEANGPLKKYLDNYMIKIFIMKKKVLKKPK